MESLRRFMSRKEDHPWKIVLNKWEEFLVSFFNVNEVARKDWNPWKEWCRSWKIYEQSHTKTPKSGKERAAVWRELYHLAKFTEDRLDEATAMRQHLQKQITELTNLQKENLLLKTNCKLLQEQLDYQQNKKILDDQRHKKELEKVENQRQASQNENKKLNATFQTALTQRDELECQISDLQRQLVQVNEDKENILQIFKYNQYYKINIVTCQCREQILDEEEESWHDMAKKAGVGCPSRYKIWKRLEDYEDPSLTVHNASYWELVIRLSRYEDLGTREPR